MSSPTQSAATDPVQQEEGQPEPQSATNLPDYDERIAVLQKSLQDVQKLETLKHRTGHNLLAHAELMFDILDAIKDLHEYIGVATLPFRATLKIIIVKQDNDKRVAALMIEMIDAMSALLELRNIKDTTGTTADGETVESKLTRVLNVIKDNIEDAGNLVDSYTKARTWHRVLHVREWAEKFKDMAETFQRGKSNIQTALGIHMVDSMTSLHPKVDFVISLMLEWFERPQSTDERNLLDHMKQGGGQIENEGEFVKLYTAHGSGERSRESSSNMSGDSRRIEDSKAKAQEAKEAWEEIKGPLADFLSENRSIFEAKLEVQKRDLSTMIRQSETTIIRAINDGPHSYIHHPDIRNLWKAMHWRLSVKTRHFVMAMHDHYLHGSYTASQEGTSHDAGVTESTPPKNTIQGASFVDPADKWCLQYLRIRHLPVISEAFDDDGSGFIRISEVNEFTGGIPKGWNLLKWVAYWAGSWPTELLRYSRLLQELMVQLSEAQLDVKPENTECVKGYMNGFAFSEVKLLVTSTDTQRTATASGRPELHRLATELRSHTEKSIQANLETVSYNIDDPDMLPVLCGPGRIEKYLFCLLYLLLKKHLEIVRYASQHALDLRELSVAATSLYNVLEKVYQRVDELKESFRQQKLDINEHFKKFACGIYSRYQYSDATKGIGLMPEHPKPEADDDGYEDKSDEDAEVENRSNDEEVPPPASDDSGSQPEDDTQTASLPGDDTNIGLQTPSSSSEKPDDQVTDIAVPAETDNTSHTVAPTGEAKAQGPDSDPVSLLDMPNEKLVQLRSWHIYFPCDACKSGPLLDRFRCPNVGPLVRPLGPVAPTINPTRFGPFCLDTSSYDNPFSLSEDSIAWPSLRAQFSVAGPRRIFGIAIQRVLERVRLLAPRMGWEYLQRRRQIRQQWVETTLYEDTQYLGKNQYQDRSPSKEEEQEILKTEMMPADVAYYNSFALLQERLRAVHWGYFCDGCSSRISGKRSRCLDCSWVDGGIDLCDACENATTPRHDVTEHPPSHTMMQFNYPEADALTSAIFQDRAQKYMIKHSKRPCPCVEPETKASSGSATAPLICDGCKKEMKKEVHFHCLQCSDYDLCGECEQEQPRTHCTAHVLLKLKAPFLDRRKEDSSEDEEEQPLSVEARLTRLTQRMGEMETNFGRRLDELQEGFTRVLSLLEDIGTQERRRAYLYESTKAPSLKNQTTSA